MKTIRKEELKRRLEDNEIILIEVLGPESYEEEHIKGAINIPVEKIDRITKNNISKDEPIAVYCSNYDCTASPTAARKLDALGFMDVYDYEGGKQEWKDAGFPME